MEVNKKFVKNLTKQWINFRDNEFDRFKNMKCSKKLDFDSFKEQILGYVSANTIILFLMNAKSFINSFWISHLFIMKNIIKLDLQIV